VPELLRVTAGYAWRLLLLGVVAYEAFTLLSRFQLIAIAVFLGLVVTSLLRPLTDALARLMPRPLAVVAALLISLALVAGLLTATGFLVAGESGRIASEFGGGITRLEHWLEGPPFHVNPTALTNLRDKITSFLSAHRSVLIQNAVSGATQIIQLLTTAALGLFCSVFFIHSGERMWAFLRDQLPVRARERWDRAGRAAWSTFAGYTRGIIIVAGTNAVLVGIALFALRVPLALPLAVLEFLAAFVPLVGSPVALAVASVVALATRGPVTALLVLALIVVIGQIEGHLLHPLIMSWAVSLHPVVVAVSVVAGSIAAGIIGAVIAVPAVSVAWAVYQALRTTPAPTRLRPPRGRR
jgi:predicted PurR-regulated permease PerM